jgi:acyl carrier protein
MGRARGSRCHRQLGSGAMSCMEIENVPTRVRAKIAQLVSIPEERISAELTLTGDLHFDSLQLYELAGELEDEFGLPELDEDDVDGIETVGDVERRVGEMLTAAVADAEGLTG